MATNTVCSQEQVNRLNPFATGHAFVWYIASAVTLVHLLTANRYGYFGDELYHMACGEHLAWGHVDQPPLIALAAWFTRHAFGTSVFAVHLLPALSGVVLVWLTGVITRELGGGPFSQALAALCTGCAAVYLVMHHILTMNAFEPLLWMGCAYVLIRVIKTGNQHLWLCFGVLAGIGLENKYSMAVFGFAVVVGLLLTPERKALAEKWIWIGGLIAFVIFLPNLIWNIQHHWPFLELMRNIRASGRDLPFTPLGCIRAQIFLMTPVTFPVWFLGTVYFFFFRTGKTFRVLGWTFLTVLLVFIVLKGKDYYASPVYPFVFAGGAVAIEQFSLRTGQAWVKSASISFVLLATLALLPLFVPVLSPESFLRYQAKLPFKIQPDEKSMLVEPMPHYYSMSFGWEDMVKGVAQAYYTLPPKDRDDVGIFANNFAAAGAIYLIGPRYGLPKAVSGHQNYWLWGPRNYSGETMIIVGETPEGAKRWFHEVAIMIELQNPYAAPWQNRPVLLCRDLKNVSSLAQAWPQVKNWD